ncbi:hypothetical protein LQZ19_09200 [Treponema primitia]|uniref:hypothetical protein n=1 Tax=Treponema primitia TaxID=88058 RepID=UPI003980E923
MTKASRPEDFPIFGSLGRDAIERMQKTMERLLGNLATVLQFDTTKIIMSKPAIFEMIERVEKRRVYFHVFYDGDKMGELNEGSLLCYWILKLHPFSCPGTESDILNAKIALCLFTNTIYCYLQDTHKKKAEISGKFVKDIYYSFRYRELTKESIMMLAASLCMA